MLTTFLSYVIAAAGLVAIAAGVWGVWVLVSDERRLPLRYFAMAIGMIAGGLGLIGLAQGLRLLLLILAGISYLYLRG